MTLLQDEKAQGATEYLLIIGLAVVAVMVVGFFVKNFVTEDVQGEFNDQIQNG